MTRVGVAAAVLVAAVALIFWGRPRPGAAELRTLRAVLAARDDNDPRLDSAFNDLSPAAKRLFREEYRRIPRERRNERGTIVFLLGRGLDGQEDWDFLKEVLAEAPCLSLADCARKPQGPGQPGDEVTLAYPALVALESARRQRGRPEAAAVLAAAKDCPAPVVARKARALL